MECTTPFPVILQARYMIFGILKITLSDSFVSLNLGNDVAY